MNTLYIHGQAAETIFEISGNNENAMTQSLGWVLSQSKDFLNILASELGIHSGFSTEVRICLQEHSSEKGITDIEIIDPEVAHIIIEAKRGFTVPSNAQLEKYAARLLEAPKANQKFLVVLAESDRDDQWLPLHVPKNVKGVDVKTLSWRRLQNLAEQSIQHGSHAEKRLLGDLKNYLGKATTMQNQNSNEVYVVSLGNSKFSASDITFIDVVEKHSKYFHPVGGGPGGWPSEPPNYIGFRYHSVLQSIHHIESYTVIENYYPHFPVPDPSPTNGPHYLYDLGPAIKPADIVRTNDAEKRFPGVTRSSRRWCYLDLLLTSGSVAEASYLSKKRKGHVVI